MKRILSFMLLFFLAGVFTMTPCFAVSYDFKQITPEIDQALKNRQARYATLQQMKRSGLVGENHSGYVTELKSDAVATSLVAQENSDRSVIYNALVEQNALGPNGLAEVQRAFAEVQRDKANSGDYIQSASGDWQQK